MSIIRSKTLCRVTKCKNILYHKSIDGTSSMMKHLRSCEANSKQNKPEGITINEYFPPTTRLIPRKT